jgi:hemoglobin/transferrin/lactoferrin receptor protein
LRLTAGARLESIHLLSFPRPQDALTPFTVDDLRMDKRWNAFTWSTGAVWGLSDAWSVAGSIAAGFRAPSFSDTLSTGVPVFASGVASVPSPKVGPERNISYEIGPRYASRRFNLMVTAYTNQLTDLVTSAPAGTIAIPGVGVVIAQQNFNSATGYVRGVEGGLAWRLGGPWIYFVNGTFTRGIDSTRNVRLRFIPPVFGTSGLRYSRANSRWWGEVALYMADRLRSHAPQDETDGGFSMDPGFGSPSATNPAWRPGFQIPGFATVTLRGSVDLLKNDQRTLSLYANLNNAANHGYRDAYAQQQLQAPGAGLVGGLRFRFSK